MVHFVDPCRRDSFFVATSISCDRIIRCYTKETPVKCVAPEFCGAAFAIFLHIRGAPDYNFLTSFTPLNASTRFCTVIVVSRYAVITTFIIPPRKKSASHLCRCTFIIITISASWLNEHAALCLMRKIKFNTQIRSPFPPAMQKSASPTFLYYYIIIFHEKYIRFYTIDNRLIESVKKKKKTYETVIQRYHGPSSPKHFVIEFDMGAKYKHDFQSLDQYKGPQFICVQVVRGSSIGQFLRESKWCAAGSLRG